MELIGIEPIISSVPFSASVETYADISFPVGGAFRTVSGGHRGFERTTA